MTIRSFHPGKLLPAPEGGTRPLSRKENTTVSLGWRSTPTSAENQALLNRMDQAKDSVTDSEYTSMLRRAADWTEDGPRIDSGNFPSDKNW